MADAPSTSSYLLLASDTENLSNSQTLTAAPGLAVQSGGAGGQCTIAPTLGLDSIVNLNASGLMVYNASGQEVSAVSLTSDASLSITNPNGIGGSPLLEVVPERTVQLLKASANSGSSIGGFPEFNFTGTGSATCSVNADNENNRVLVNYNVAAGSGSGTVTSVAAVSSGSLTISGSPITSSGTLNINLPVLGTNGTYTNPVLTVDTYGRITAADSGSGGNGTVTSIGISSSNGSLSISGSPVTSSGIINIQLTSTGVSSGSYTNSNVTVDGFGRVTAISNGSAAGSISGTTNQINSTTVSGNTTLSIPSDFRAPGTIRGTSITLGNSSQSTDVSALSYYKNATDTLEMQYGHGTDTFDVPVYYERIGNTVIITLKNTHMRCDKDEPTSILECNTQLPSDFAPSGSSIHYIGSGYFLKYDENDDNYQSTVPFIATIQSRRFTFNLTSTDFNAGNYYQFGAAGNTAGDDQTILGRNMVFTYSIIQPT